MKFLAIMLWAVMCQAQKTNKRNLNMKLNRLTRVTDVLQKDVSDIWTIITASGIENLEFGNKTRTDTDNFEQKGKCVIEDGKGTMTEVQEMKTEVEQLILYSKIGLKNEKEFQRDSISDLERSYKEFQAGMIEKNTEMEHKVESMNKQVSDLQETSKDNQLRFNAIEHNLNENMDKTDHGVLLESMKQMLEIFSERLSRVETENQELKQIIINLEEVQVKCDEDWTSFNGHCYLFIKQNQNWHGALATCKSKGSYLLEIGSESELNFVSGLVHGFSIVWIGATNTLQGYEGTFVYQDSKSPVPEKFWGDGQPRNLEYNQCVALRKMHRHSKFYDLPCIHFPRKFVCEKPGTLVTQ